MVFEDEGGADPGSEIDFVGSVLKIQSRNGGRCLSWVLVWVGGSQSRLPLIGQIFIHWNGE